MILLKKEALLC